MTQQIEHVSFFFFFFLLCSTFCIGKYPKWEHQNGILERSFYVLFFSLWISVMGIHETITGCIQVWEARGEGKQQHWRALAGIGVHWRLG